MESKFNKMKIKIFDSGISTSELEYVLNCHKVELIQQEFNFPDLSLTVKHIDISETDLDYVLLMLIHRNYTVKLDGYKLFII